MGDVSYFPSTQLRVSSLRMTQRILFRLFLRIFYFSCYGGCVWSLFGRRSFLRFLRCVHLGCDFVGYLDDIDDEMHKLGCEIHIDSTLAYSEGSLRSVYSDIRGFRVLVDIDGFDLRGCEGIRQEILDFRLPLNNVELFMFPELIGHDLDTDSFLADTCAHRVHTSACAPYRDLRTLTWSADNRFDLDCAGGDLGYFTFKELCKKLRICT